MLSYYPTIFARTRRDLLAELEAWLEALGIEPDLERLERVVDRHYMGLYEAVAPEDLRRLGYWAMRAHGVPSKQAARWARQ